MGHEIVLFHFFYYLEKGLGRGQFFEIKDLREIMVFVHYVVLFAEGALDFLLQHTVLLFFEFAACCLVG